MQTILLQQLIKSDIIIKLSAEVILTAGHYVLTSVKCHYRNLNKGLLLSTFTVRWRVCVCICVLHPKRSSSTMQTELTPMRGTETHSVTLSYILRFHT